MISRNSFALLSLLAAGAATVMIAASPVEADKMPLPRARPLGFAADMPSRDITGTILRPDSATPAIAALKNGLDALSDKDPPVASLIGVPSPKLFEFTRAAHKAVIHRLSRRQRGEHASALARRAPPPGRRRAPR